MRIPASIFLVVLSGAASAAPQKSASGSAVPGGQMPLTGGSGSLVPPADAPTLPDSAFTEINLATLPDAKEHSPAEWRAMVKSVPGDGARAILDSMSDAPPSSPHLTVTLKNGETVSGEFRGLAQDKMIFASNGKVLGLPLKTQDVAKVRRLVDINFDGNTFRPQDVVVHSQVPVEDPFKDLSAYKGRVVDMVVRDLDDLKWSARTISGRIKSVDEKEGVVTLERPKGEARVKKEVHRIDKVELRTERFSSRGKVGSISEVEQYVPNGTPVELILRGDKKAAGRFMGIGNDHEGSYVILEVDKSGGGKGFRGFRDVWDLRTSGPGEDALLPDAQRIYTLPE